MAGARKPQSVTKKGPLTTKPQTSKDRPRTPATSRRRRTLGVIVVLVLGVLGLLYGLPQTSAGRGWLLSKVQGALVASGYTLTFDSSAGNPWRGVTLREPVLTGPGVDVSLEKLGVSYTLPALLTGKLPLFVDAETLRGAVSPDEFPARVGGGGGLSIEPVLRSLTLDDAALTVGGTAFAVPGLTLSGLTVSGKGGAYRWRGTATTPDGSATLGGRASLSPFVLEADIARADLRLARPWWSGANGGTLSGRVTVRGREVTGRFELTDAATTLAGVTLTGISGPVTLDYPQIEADLTGRALGGPVAATGGVNVADKRWQAEVTGQAGLEAAAHWLARGHVDEGRLGAVPLTGEADVSLTISGWREVALGGTAAGAGTVAGRALEDLNADFGFETGVGVNVTAAAEVAGAPVALALEPDGAGLELRARASEVPLVEGLTGNFDVTVKSDGNGSSGGGTLGVAGEAWGRALSVDVEGSSDGAALSLTLNGESSLGETLTGTLSLGDGTLQGELTAQNLTAPVLEAPFTLRLLADGPLEALPLALELDAPGPLELVTGGSTLSTDLRGRATATLSGTELINLTGSFGGLQVSGNVDPVSRRGSLNYSLGNIPLRGPVTGSIALSEGTLTLDGNALRTEARLRSSPLDAGAFGLPALDAGVTLAMGEAGDLTATLQDPDNGLTLALQEGEVAATFEETPVTLGGEAATLDGRADFGVDAPLEGLVTELTLAGALGAARLEGDASGTRLELRAEPGFALGPLTLAQAADLSGTLDLEARQARLAGRLGALEGTLDVSLPDEAASLTLENAGEALRVDAALASGTVDAWSAVGSLPLAPLGEALGLPVTGTLSSDLSVESGRYSGETTFDGSVRGQAVRGALRGAGDTLAVEAQAPVAGQTATLSGALLPDLGARLELPLMVGDNMHVVEGILAGPPLAPTLEGAVSGPFVSGPLELSRAGLTSTLTLEPAAWLSDDGVAGALELSPISVTLSATPDARWKAVATTTDPATDPEETGARPQTLPLDLQAEITGEGARYTGEGVLALAGESVPFSLRGQGEALSGEAALQIALEPLSALLPLSLRGAADGAVTFQTGDGLVYDADVNLTGTAQGQPFDLTLAATPQRLAVTGEAAGAAVDLNGTPEDGFAFTVEDAARALELAGTLNLTDGLTLEGAGRVAQEPITLSAFYSPDDARANLNVSAAGATLSGSLQGTQFEVQARASEESFLSAAARLELTGQVASGEVTVTDLTLRSALLDEPLALQLAGAAWPNTNLSGSLEWGFLPEPSRVSLVESGDLYKVFLKQDALLASVYVRKGALAQLGLEGEANLGFEDIGTVVVTSDLVWTPEGGYQGGAELALEPSEPSSPEDTQAQLTLSGDGGLTLAGEARVRGAVMALEALLGPSLQNPMVEGDARLEAPLSTLAPTWPGDALTLVGDVTLSGNVRAPVMTGPVRLEGVLTYDGTLQANPEGATVTLTGPGLELSASADAGGWTLTTEAKSLDVAPFVPQVSVPRFSGTLEASQAWGEPLRASLSGLEFWTLRSEVSGALEYEGELTGTLAGHLDLADWGETPLRGVLRGEVALGDAGVAGTLRLESLGLQSAPWGLSGTATLGGSPANPELDLRLTGEGSAEGTLVVTLSPGEKRAFVQSDLAVAEVSSSLLLTLAPGAADASGEVAWGDYSFVLSALEGAVRFEGAGALAGWTAELDPARGALALDGNLDAFEALAGAVDVTVDPQGEAWLEGALTGVRVGSVPVGTVALRGSGTEVEVDGEAVAGALELGTRTWTLQRLELPLPAGLGLTASGTGGLAQGALTGTFSGNFAGEETTVAWTSRYGDGTLDVTADGGLLSGDLNANARYEDGWSGRLELAGASLGGVTADVQGELSGDLAAPQFSGQVQALAGESRLGGTVSVSSQGVTLEQTLTSPRLDAPLTVSGEVWPAPALFLESGGERLELHQNPDGSLASQGSLTLAAAGFGLTLDAPEGSGGLEGVLETPVPGFVLAAALPSTPEALTLRFEGRERAGGALVLAWDDGLTLATEDLNYQTEAGTLSLSGTVASTGTGFQGTLNGRWAGAGGDLLPWLAGADVPFGVGVDGARVTLESESALGRLEAGFDGRDLALNVDAALQTGAGAANVRLAYTPEAGPQGTVTLDAVPLLGGDAPLSLESDLTLDAGGLAGDARLLAGGGTLRAEGALGWARLVPERLRARFLPLAENTLRGTLRAANVDLAALPGVGLPYLHAPLSGVAEFGGENVAGQLLLPEARVLETPLPTELEFNGTLAQIDVRGSLGESRVDLAWNGRTLSGLVNLENFPLETLAEAVVGDTGTQASVTGVARLELPVAKPAQGRLEVATERVRLARGEAVSEGNAAFRFEAGALVVDEVRFSGAGEWRAEGRVTRDAIEGTVEAENADFGPLLGLVPRLAELGVGAQGSFTLRAAGSLAEPDITLVSPELALRVGGAAGRLENTEGQLTGETLAVTSTLQGTTPVTGSLAIEGGGRLDLLPLETTGLRFGFGGGVTLPVLGAVENLRGEIAAEAAGWTLDAGGDLGAPFSVAGTLAPLDLRLTGTGLDLRAPRYFLASSATNADLRLRAGELDDLEDAFVLSGGLEATEAQLVGDREAGEVAGAGTGEAVEEAVGEAAEEATEAGAANPLFERVLFDNVTLRAPQEVRFTAGYGSAELGLDLTLSGSAAAPKLAGEAEALRGSFGFSGRDFTLDRAVASFDPSRGVTPVLDVTAHTSFDKSAVLRGGTARRVDIVEPRGASFDVLLALEGELGADAADALAPELSSPARIEVPGEGGPRPLSDGELLSLLTVGRLELGSTLVGEEGVAGSVAGSAVDTAVELFILSELQNAIGDALGLDLTIQTSPLSNVISGNDAPFGVSLELGGYVDEDLFASYRIGSYSDPVGAYALSNEFSLSYDLAPLKLNLAGGLNFTETFDAVPAFGIALSYDLAPLTFDAGLDVTELEQRFGLGVSIRW